MKFSDFGFKENPFAITPDPHYLFLSRGHEESLAHLIYGTGPNGGFVQLTGEVGTGKTLLVRSLLEQKLEDVDIALILHPRLSRREFLAAICDELGVKYEGPPYRLKPLIDNLIKHLLKTHAAGRHTVVVIDEAQNLSPRVLEQVRLLTNLETSRHKLLRIILVGQPELQKLLARKDLRQVNQRITARYHLYPLSRAETANYIRHRLTVGGADHDLFTPGAMKLVHFLSRGVPRMINTLCERTLLAIFTTGSKRASLGMVWRAYREIKGRHGWLRVGQWVLGGLLVAFSGTAVWLGLMQMDRQSAVTETVVAVTNDGMQDVGTEAAGEILPISNTLQVQSGVVEGAKNAAQAAGQHKDASDGQNKRIQQILQKKLFSLWGKPLQSETNGEFCRLAMQAGLRCLSGSASWSDVKQFDRPLLLNLRKGDAVLPVLVVKMRGEQLLLDEGQGERWVAKKEIAEDWRGDFIMLWRPPKGGALVGPGSSGNAVTWLRQRLSLADAEPVPTIAGVDHFEEELAQRLRRFQRAKGLTPDGIAGAWTMILLNNLMLPANTPTLMVGD